MKKLFSLLMLAGALAMVVPACKSKPKDADIQTAVVSALANIPGVAASVSEGVVTLTGTVADEAARTAAETAAKAVAGVKSIANNITVAPPVIAEDPVLVEGVANAVKAFSGVVAEVKEGVVKLTGEIKRADLAKLMQALNALKPKSIDNQLTVK